MFKLDLEGFKVHLISRGASPNTIKGYMGDLGQFQEFLSRKPDIQSWKEAVERWLSKGHLKKSTRKRKFAALRAYARWKEIGEILSMEMKWGREENLPKVLSSDELKEFLRETKVYASEKSDYFLVPAVYLMAHLGLRISELLDIRVGDINLNTMTIRLRGKGEKDAVLPIPRGLKKILKNIFLVYKNAPKDMRLFRYSYYTLYRRIKEIGRRIGKEVTPHTLRHTTATEMLKRGINLRVVQKVLRHASISTTQKYIHLTVEDLRKEIDRVKWDKD